MKTHLLRDFFTKKVSFIPQKVPFIAKVKKQVKVCYSIYEKKNLIKCYFILI